VIPVGDGTAEVLGLTGRAASIGDAVIGALIPAGPLWLTGWIYEKVRRRQGLGFGDVLMIAEVGAFLGLSSAFLTLFLASVAGSVIGLVTIKVRQEDAETYQLPLGSFLGASGIFVSAFGGALSRWYAAHLL
jgi:leader peptidase (prepilin peptidase)/N-methyltransferase